MIVKYDEPVVTNAQKSMDIELPFFYQQTTTGLHGDVFEYYGKVDAGSLSQITMLNGVIDGLLKCNFSNKEIVDCYLDKSYKKITKEEFELLKDRIINSIKDI